MDAMAKLREQLSAQLQSLSASTCHPPRSARDTLFKDVNHTSFVSGSGYAPFEDVRTSSSHGDANYNVIFAAQNKRYAQELLLEGRARSQAGNDADAAALFTEALVFCPDDADIYCCRGCVRANMNEYSKAIDDFYKCLSIDKDHSDATEYLRRTLERGGFLREASQVEASGVIDGNDNSSKRSSSSDSSSSSSSDSSAERKRRRRKKEKKRRKKEKKRRKEEKRRRKRSGSSGDEGSRNL